MTKVESIQAVLANCFGCGRTHDVGDQSAGKDSNGLKCNKCGGYVITPSGKINVKEVVFNGKKNFGKV